METIAALAGSIVGASNSGKTVLLSAFQQACSVGTEDEFRLRFRPRGKTTELLDRVMLHYLEGAPLPGSNAGTTRYPFDVLVQPPGKPRWRAVREPGARVYSLEVIDGPGGQFFPRVQDAKKDRPFAPELIAHARESESLIFCVDSTDPGLAVLRHGLPKFLDAVREPDEPFVPFSRVLLLLTKIDRLAGLFSINANHYRLAQETEAGPVLRSLCRPAFSNRYFADSIDPVEQAISILGPIPQILRQAMAPEAKLAVGLSSAFGFDSFTGQAMVDPETGEFQQDEDRSQVLNRWRPYGIREALLFVTMGVIRHPVVEVEADECSLPPDGMLLRVPVR